MLHSLFRYLLNLIMKFILNWIVLRFGMGFAIARSMPTFIDIENEFHYRFVLLPRIVGRGALACSP